MQATNGYRSAWLLPQGQALRRVVAGSRLLRVARGRLWVTRDGSLTQPADDCVLSAGELMSLRPGEGVVIEALADSEMEFLEPAVAPARMQAQRASPRIRSWQAALLQPLQVERPGDGRARHG